ncbi:hypothetical protein ABT336_10600 [Micromonospora sp. NPDC000207]|uniref:hypothetical protein n=1 Tax=Micromonospora sp. NPDC000207 TaxID=3154246 RepID=UPI00332A2BA5
MVLVGLVLVLASAACGATGGAGEPAGGGAESETREPAPVDPTGVTGPAVVACGQALRPTTAGGLTVTGRFPATVSAGRQVVEGEVEVESRDAVRVVAPGAADVFLVREGRVVALPGPQDAVGVRWDLRPGEARTLPGGVPLVLCESGGGPAPAGSYELYARVVVTTDEGAVVESYGGPWPLTVR